MPRNLSRKTLVFLECLGEALADAASTLAHPSISRFGSGGYDDEPLERKLFRLAERGVIALPEPADPRIVRLTELGQALASGPLPPAARWSRPWDGLWRMVLFDIAEHERPVRDRLRDTLHAAKLGYLQGSVWISPDPLDALRNAIRTMTSNPEALLFFEGRPYAGEPDSALVNGAWNFPRLAEAHRDCLALLAAPPPSTAPRAQWRAWLIRERETWQRALDLDPLLPEVLLPKGYLGQEVHRRRRTLLRTAFTHAFT